MLRKFIFKNYMYTMLQLQFAEVNLNTSVMKNLQDDFLVAKKEMERLKRIQLNVNMITLFLTNFYNHMYSHTVTTIPQITVDRGQGNSVGISKYLLENLDKNILVITSNIKSFLRSEVDYSSLMKVSFKKPSESFRGILNNYSMIILDGVGIEKTDIPPEHMYKVVRVG